MGRPNCQQPTACIAKGKGHCRSCHMKAATKAAASRKLSWCIPALVEDYRLLARHLGAVEARKIIEEQIAEYHAEEAA